MLINLLFLSVFAIGAGLFIFALIYIDAKFGWHFTTITTNTFKFVAANDTLIRVIDGRNMLRVIEKDCHGEEVVVERPRIQGWLERNFGIVYVSWMFPIKRIHSIKVVTDKIKDNFDKSNPDIQTMIVSDKKEVYELRDEVVHPLFIQGVDLSNGATIDLVLIYWTRTKNPCKMVTRSGNWETIHNTKTIDEWMTAEVNAFFNGDKDKMMSLQRALNEDRGPGSRFRSHIIGKISALAEKEIGLEIFSIAGSTLVPSPGNPVNKQILEAIAQEEIAKATAAANIAEAVGQAQIDITQAEGYKTATNIKTDADARRAKDLAQATATVDVEMIEKIKKTGMSDEAIAQIIATGKLPEGITHFTIVSGSGVTPVIDINKEGGK